MTTYAVLREHRKGGAEIIFTGSYEECRELCEKMYKGSELNDFENDFWGNEESNCQVIPL
jgi:hypothetical protein